MRARTSIFYLDDYSFQRAIINIVVGHFDDLMFVFAWYMVQATLHGKGWAVAWRGVAWAERPMRGKIATKSSAHASTSMITTLL